MRPARVVAALVGDRVAAFELGTAAQVFGLDRSGEGFPVTGFLLCGPRPGPVPTTTGFDVHVPHGLDALERADLVVVPAWPDLDAPLPPGVAEGVRAAVDRGADVLTICSGAFVPAAAGLLDGRAATTHWQFADRFARSFPRVRLQRDVLYAEDGPFVTSAGAAAGLDACLHVVRRDRGAAHANALARRLVTAAHREGGQAQFVDHPVPEAGDELAAVLDWARDHLDRELTVAELARRALTSPRTFARRFRAATGTTPHRWLVEERLRRAEELLERTDLTVEAVARRCGAGTADALRRQFAARRGVGPATHRRTFRDPLAGPTRPPSATLSGEPVDVP
ncbi:helix-turn-helix domain-containing protein [Kineococcus aurantiacus]|uniref:Transcriptional regulator GlxA family with amidase domain n=1 Tax=Kineococcus aurantiacus TaxID=37633 RepID=A0A7Y9DKH8_9ACTN|nr:transcriptional regulator GlxA family with amidase domain [Kineococcus aurantiacus]